MPQSNKGSFATRKRHIYKSYSKEQADPLLEILQKSVENSQKPPTKESTVNICQVVSCEHLTCQDARSPHGEPWNNTIAAFLTSSSSPPPNSEEPESSMGELEKEGGEED